MSFKHSKTKSHVHRLCVHGSLATHRHTHTYLFTENKETRSVVSCCLHSASRHHNPSDGEARTIHRLAMGAKGYDVVHLHTYTHAGVSTRLEHVPAACMLVCMCNHACCYLRAGQGRVVHGRVRSRDSRVCRGGGGESGAAWVHFGSELGAGDGVKGAVGVLLPMWWGRGLEGIRAGGL